MSSSSLLNPATGKISGAFLPSGISIPTDQLSSPTILGTSTSLADDGAGGFYVQDTHSASNTILSVGDGTTTSVLVKQSGMEFGVEPYGFFPFVNFSSPGGTPSAALQTITSINGLPIASTAAVAQTIAPRTWTGSVPNVLAQNVPTSASAGQHILLEVSAQLRLSPTAPFVGADTQLLLTLTGVPGVVVVPPLVPSFSSNLLLQYQNGAVSAQTFPVSFAVIVNSTGSAAWSFFLSALSQNHSYTATFQDAVVLKATTLAN